MEQTGCTMASSERLLFGTLTICAAWVVSWTFTFAEEDVYVCLTKSECIGNNNANIAVLANGTTRLQLDIVKSSDLPFDMLFSTKSLGITKVCLCPSVLFFKRQKAHAEW
jgi:hypothetical protein